MSFSGQTPESLLPRSDSKNPATTCKGITSVGRACRRGLASPTRRDSGVLAVLQNESEKSPAAPAAFYCWQHKDQARDLLVPIQNENLKKNKKTRDETKIWHLKQKSSIDTLVEKVGILELDEERPMRVKKREKLPDGWNELEGPLMSVPEEFVEKRKKDDGIRNGYGYEKDRSRSNVKVSWACCIQADSESDDDMRVVRRHKDGSRTNTRPRPRPLQTSNPPSQQINTNTIHRKRTPQSSAQSQQQNQSTSSNHTPTLLSLIPPHLTPQTTSLILSELSRPISPADESGYIYIFWLTPPKTYLPDNTNNNDNNNYKESPDEDAASSLLEFDHDMKSYRDKEALLRRYASIHPFSDSHFSSSQNPRSTYPTIGNEKQQGDRKITLKIGRASNVHRRLNQWSKQCGMNITLIRYYPNAALAAAAAACSSANSTIPSIKHTTIDPAKAKAANAAKIPHINRVERLIHLELSSYRVHAKTPCGTCGCIHREWFEVPATRAGLREVDGVVKRWMDWGFNTGITT